MTAAAEPETDEALVARLSKRDEGALRELHRRHAALVFTVAARVVGETSAEDVVQDVFVTLWQKHEAFDPERGKLKPWLARIARRRALNTLRATKREGVHEPSDADEIEADAPPPDEASWLAHRQAVVRAAVDALPEAQRRALSLAFFDQLTHDQVARALGTPIGTTKTRIRLGLKRLAPVLLVALAMAVAWVLSRRDDRDARALRMVTASDVVPIRLSAAPGEPPEAHGSYRRRDGSSVAVLTTSALPVVESGETYVAWAHDAAGWHRLGTVTVEADHRSLLVAEVKPDVSPDELRVTREVHVGSAPSGAEVLRWDR